MKTIALIILLLLALRYFCVSSDATRKELEYRLNNPDEQEDEI